MGAVGEHSKPVARRFGWVIDSVAPPRRGGWVVTAGREILHVGGDPGSGVKRIDCRDLAILPAMVNAHAHLEFSDLTAPIGHRGISLPAWIAAVIEHRAGRTIDPLAAIARGHAEATAGGTAVIVDIEGFPPPDGAPPVATPGRHPMREVLGLAPPRATDTLAVAEAALRDRTAVGISPHAAYSTLPSSIDRCVSLSRQFRCPLAMHVAESPAERELLAGGTGEFADVLASMGILPPGLFPWPGGRKSFVDLIERLAGADQALIVHGNDLSGEEIETIARHQNLTVVVCPRTHDFFGFDRHPIDQIIRLGVPVCLGTDSRASNPDLDLWGEVRFLLRHRQDLPPAAVLRAATLGGAAALGIDRLGRVAQGHRGWITRPCSATSIDGVWEKLCG